MGIGAVVNTDNAEGVSSGVHRSIPDGKCGLVRCEFCPMIITEPYRPSVNQKQEGNRPQRPSHHITLNQYGMRHRERHTTRRFDSVCTSRMYASSSPVDLLTDSLTSWSNLIWHWCSTKRHQFSAFLSTAACRPVGIGSSALMMISSKSSSSSSRGLLVNGLKIVRREFCSWITAGCHIRTAAVSDPAALTIMQKMRRVDLVSPRLSPYVK